MGTIFRFFENRSEKTHKYVFFEFFLYLWVDMTHTDGPNPDHTGVDYDPYDPRYGEVNAQVWALQPYYSMLYNRNSVKK
jgi:hypothetical protein